MDVYLSVFLYMNAYFGMYVCLIIIISFLNIGSPWSSRSERKPGTDCKLFAYMIILRMHHSLDSIIRFKTTTVFKYLLIHFD